MYELRWILEPAALLKAGPNVPLRLLGEMRTELQNGIAAGRSVRSIQLDRLEEQLHFDLLSYCGNDTVMETLQRYQSLPISHSFLYSWATRIYDSEPFLAEHMAIVERLEHGRFTAAAALLEDHLRLSRDRAHRSRLAHLQTWPLAYMEAL